MSEGHEFRPSASERWIPCPASAAAHEDSVQSDAAREGTFLHEVAEKAITNCLGSRNLLLEEFIGNPPDTGHSAVNMALEKIWPLIEKGTRVLPEYPLFYLRGVWGTADLVLLHSDGSASLVDWKFGVNLKVDATSKQMEIYSRALLEMMRIHGCTSVVAHIVQPRHRDGFHHSWHGYVADSPEHQKFADEVSRSLKSALEGDDPVPGEWCRWCPHKRTCPATAEAARSVLSKFSL